MANRKSGEQNIRKLTKMGGKSLGLTSCPTKLYAKLDACGIGKGLEMEREAKG